MKSPESSRYCCEVGGVRHPLPGWECKTEKLTIISNTGFTPPANQATRIRPSCSNVALTTFADLVPPRLNEIVADDLGERVATFSFDFLDVVAPAGLDVGKKIEIRPDAESTSNLGWMGDLEKDMCLASESSGAEATSFPSLPKPRGTSHK